MRRTQRKTYYTFYNMIMERHAWQVQLISDSKKIRRKRTQPDCSDCSDLVQKLDRELLQITWRRIYDKTSYSEGEMRARKCGANLLASLWQRSKSRFFQRCQPPAPSRRFRRHLRRESFSTSVCKLKRNSTGLNIICWEKITKVSPWTSESHTTHRW